MCVCACVRVYVCVCVAACVHPKHTPTSVMAQVAVSAGETSRVLTIVIKWRESFSDKISCMYVCMYVCESFSDKIERQNRDKFETKSRQNRETKSQQNRDKVETKSRELQRQNILQRNRIIY
jgi:hypothetical protein